MRICTCVTGIALAAGLAGFASAQVEFHSGASIIDDPIDVATFDDLVTGDPLQDYEEAGLRIHVNDTMFTFNPCGFPNAEMYYPNGGVFEMINITRLDGEDFGVIELNVSDGWASCEVYMWIRAFLDGDLVNEFDADVDGGELVGMSGTFDEVHIASYFLPETRDLHDPFEYNAIALDNVAYASGGGVSLSVDGSCPGSMSFNVSGATPSGNVAYIYAFGTGNVIIPGGVCQGTELGLNGTATLGGVETADANGDATLTTNVPAGACGNVFVQALDVPTCTPSNVEGI